MLGGVVHPGVYSFPEGSRVQDAITAAGGLVADVDPNSINLVAKPQDGEQLNIAGGTSEAAGALPGALSNSPFTVLPTSSGPFTVIPTPAGSIITPDLIDINRQP